MTNEEETVLMIRGEIASMSPEEQGRIKDAIEEIKRVRATYGDAADMAIALIGAELAFVGLRPTASQKRYG